jgi:hypothetical protein
MKRAWIALALLSASWLFGLSYYHQANWAVWAVLIAAGTLLLMGVDARRPSPAVAIVTAALTVPAIWLAPWPYRAAILLVFLGVLLSAAPIPRRWPTQLGAAGISAGAILIVQSLGILLYESVTARSHELPTWLAYPIYGITKLLGITASLDGTTIAIHSMRRVHQLGATWELLLDPVTWSFLLGGIALLYMLAARGRREGHLKLVASLVIPVALWLPVRSTLLIALLAHRALRTEYEAPLMLMNQFWSPWLHLVLLVGPVLLAMRFVRPGPQADDITVSHAKLSRRVVPAALACAAVLLVVAAMLWDPAGPRKRGRILVDEYIRPGNGPTGLTTRTGTARNQDTIMPVFMTTARDSTRWPA